MVLKNVQGSKLEPKCLHARYVGVDELKNGIKYFYGGKILQTRNFKEISDRTFAWNTPSKTQFYEAEQENQFPNSLGTAPQCWQCYRWSDLCYRSHRERDLVGFT